MPPITWLAAIHTASVLTIWNRSPQMFSVIDASMIKSMMMPQIAILALFFLDKKF
jgi:hypothetical protein